MSSPPPSTQTFDIAIVGGGPVGLLLACLLGDKGLKVAVLERRTEPPQQSQAIGITPPSLKILAKLGLEQEFIHQGVKVRDCHVYGESGHLGCVSFRDIPGDHRFILSLPQSETETLLQRRLKHMSQASLFQGVDVREVRACKTHCVLTTGSGSSGRTGQVKARYVVACDGSRSALRESLQIKTTSHTYGVHFLMGDFIDRTSFKYEAHLFFTALGAVETFPLPCGLRRWIVQTREHIGSPTPGLLTQLVQERARVTLDPEDQLNESAFTPRRLNCDRYHHGRVILCGDAAHVMSPIGGQGMNTGFADAEFLADALSAIMLGKARPEPLLAAYHRYRHKAAQTATDRAAMGMWLGTWTGRQRSRLRDFIIRHLLCRGPVRHHLGPLYAMLTIPYNTMDRVPAEALNPQPRHA